MNTKKNVIPAPTNQNIGFISFPLKKWVKIEKKLAKINGRAIATINIILQGSFKESYHLLNLKENLLIKIFICWRKWIRTTVFLFCEDALPS